MSGMKCKELAEFLIDYVGNELPPNSRAEFELHLDRCGNCKAYLVQYEVVIKAGKIACDDVGDELKIVPDELVKAVMAARAKA